jgi:hypothetical protein
MCTSTLVTPILSTLEALAVLLLLVRYSPYCKADDVIRQSVTATLILAPTAVSIPRLHAIRAIIETTLPAEEGDLAVCIVSRLILLFLGVCHVLTV